MQVEGGSRHEQPVRPHRSAANKRGGFSVSTPTYAAIALALIVILGPLVVGGNRPFEAPAVSADIIESGHKALVLAQDDNDNEEEDDNGNTEDDNDNTEDDNDNVDDDNDNTEDDNDNLFDDNDNTEDDNDNVSDDDDNGGFVESAPVSPASSGPATLPELPTVEAAGTSTGGDSSIPLGVDRVVIRIFPWMPAGVTIKLRAVDPATVAAIPGNRVGNLVFRIDAQDATGRTLDALPAEVNLSVRYSDQEIRSLNESNVTLSRLSPLDNQWRPAPKLVPEASSNYIAASIVDLGVYAVHVP
jgi:hypothetical protein